MTFRVNYLQIERFDSSPEGVMTVEAIARHPGVLTYYKADGSTRKELVPVELLRGFDSSGMPLAAKLGGIPVSNEHPSSLFKFLPESRRDALVKGAVAEDGVEVYSDGRIKVRFHVTDAQTQDDIRSGRKDGVSLGYEVGSVEKSGVWNKQRYDAMQAQPFEADHLAVVKYPRADEARIVRFDSTEDAAASDVAWQIFKTDSIEVPMATIRLDSGVTVEADPALVAAWDSMHENLRSSKKKNEEMEEDKKKMKEEFDAAQEEARTTIDSLNETMEYMNSRLDELEKADAERPVEPAMDSDEIAAAVQDRVDAWMDVAAAVGQPVNFDGTGIVFDSKLDGSEIRKALLSTRLPEMNLDSMSSDTLKGLYLGVFKASPVGVAAKKDSTPSLQAQLQAAVLGGAQTPKQDSTVARMDKQQRQMARSRQPIHAKA